MIFDQSWACLGIFGLEYVRNGRFQYGIDNALKYIGIVAKG